MQKSKVNSKKYIKMIMRDYCYALIDSLPAPDKCNFTFSSEFERKMDVLFKQYKKYQIVNSIKKCIAAVFIAIICSSSLYLAINVEVRATVFEWIQQVYENSIVYKYFGEKKIDKLPEYELGYLPDDFVEVDGLENEMMKTVFFMNINTEDVLIFEYGFIDGTSNLTVFDIDVNKKSEKILINGYEADFYEADIQSMANSLIWFDNTHSIIFKLDSSLDKQTIIKISEGIKQTK